MTNIDRILNIHQSYSLKKVSDLNKQILIAQYAQTEQISKLEKEMKASNDISREILYNQLHELKHKETLRYYKDLAFSMNDAVSIIEKTDNQLLSLFLCDLYLSVIEDCVQNAKSNLEEIADKEYCERIKERIETLKCNAIKSEADYLQSDFKKMLNCKNDFEIQSKELRKLYYKLEAAKIEANPKKTSLENWVEKQNNKQKPLVNKSRGCLMSLLWVLLSVFILLTIISTFEDIQITITLLIISVLPIGTILYFVKRADKKWRNNYSQYLEDFNRRQNPEDIKYSDDIIEQEQIILDFENKLNNHLYLELKKGISQQVPNWEIAVGKIYNIIPQPPQEKKDSLFVKVAQYIIDTQVYSISNIQRKFEIGHIRASKLAAELERCEIVQNDIIRKKTFVTIFSPKMLNYILKEEGYIDSNEQ